MAICSKCGAQVGENVKFCSSCGAPMEAPAPEESKSTDKQSGFGEKLAGLKNTADTTGEYDAKDIADNKLMAVLAYLGPLWLIPFFARKDSKFTQFHCKQGFTLLLIEVAYSIISAILRAIIKVSYTNVYGYVVSYTPGWVGTVLWLISIPIFVVAIIGILNAANGKAKELPVIGKYKILK